MTDRIPAELETKVQSLLSQKVPGKIHWSSSPDRGIENLAYLLPWIQERVPDVKIHVDVYYGLGNLRIAQPDLAKRLDELMKTAGEGTINFVGRVGQKELAEHWKKAWLFLYPTWFAETYCCSSSTLVEMADGSFKPIPKVEVGDFVRTHAGRSAVTQIMSRPYSGKMLSFGVSHLYDNLEVTPEHPVFVLRRRDGVCTKECEHLTTDFDPQWVPAKEMNVGDYVVYPKNVKQEKPCLFSELLSESLDEYNRKYPINRIQDFAVDEDFLEICGWYCAEGSNDGSSIISFSLNSKETDIANNILGFFSKFGIVGRIHTSKTSDSITCIVHSAIFRRFFDTFGHGAQNRHIPNWIKDLEPRYIKYFLRGLYHGDGSSTRNVMRFECSSNRLVHDLFDVLLKFDMITSVGHTQKRKPYGVGDKIRRHTDEFLPAYSAITSRAQNTELVDFLGYGYDERGHDDLLTDSRYVYLQIKEINEHEYNDLVYNLEVDEDHSYLANWMIVHNCITANEAMLSATPILCSDEAALNTTVGQYGIRIPGYQGWGYYSREARIQFIDEAVKLFTNKDHWRWWARRSFLGSLQGLDWDTRYKKYWKPFLD